MANLFDNDMNANQKKISWSKAGLLSTGLIFVAVLLFVAYMYTHGNIESGFDTAALVTAITVSGTIFASNLCWYSKKAASENHYKLRMGLYSDSAKVRLQYNEEMMKLMKKYNMTQEDVDSIDNNGEIDEMMSSAIGDVISGLDSDRDSADSENSVETV